ncbi:PTS sugar transporter subunit IIA [Vibrio aestuarianus]|uniref:PTS fructose transporter subunit IIA n=1 Tax=Vibrio aestuarianus TaxID=28171 RepID=A0A9X4FAJ6_9VIBR|nr:PTS fructose transporter subunit IIA [Vibrio aestuarianus]MDE1236019.1 PTS fructose transporter subunit IIA [Vibrio aestuarianus]MDE1246897.1 PTS fructose transporter subunit IIA [Vibrio aestuarianus]MDE1315152.1 PTS fructose transporter subunit IIA [Vibrio aestuarianus]MDE1347498.1 PTS fructose transporter subunit IIA [Vibrio aestuarianus]NGZ64235.1 PTS fructose transporter subunit IIA [Vibrio aestuarianus subsp. cardii]
MIHFIVATHGPLCTALITSGKMVFGEMPHVTPVSLSEDGGIEDFKVDFKKTITEIANTDVDGIVVLCDLECGTPYNVACTYAFDDSFPCDVEVVSGVNFPTLLMTGDFEEDKSACDVAAALKGEALNTIVHAQKPQDTEDLEEDF